MAKLAELAHESPGTTGTAEHVHVASCSRRRLRRIARKAHRMGLAVREFPPFDCIDPVHATGSYHYRRKGHCEERATAPVGAERCTRKNLAMDVSGDLHKEHDFFVWVLNHYGHPSGWFVAW